MRVMYGQDVQQLAGGRVPNARRVVIRSGGEAGAVRAKGHGELPAVVAAQHRKLLPGEDVSQAHGSVVGSRHEARAVGAERHGPLPAAVIAAHDRERFARRGIPDSDAPIVGRGLEPGAVGVECDGANLVERSAHAERLARSPRLVAQPIHGLLPHAFAVELPVYAWHGQAWLVASSASFGYAAPGRNYLQVLIAGVLFEPTTTSL